MSPLERGRAYCDAPGCDWHGPERDDWAESFHDLAEHYRETAHGPRARALVDPHALGWG